MSEEEIAIKENKDSLMEGSKEMSLLKMMDRSMHQHHNNGVLGGNLIRNKSKTTDQSERCKDREEE